MKKELIAVLLLVFFTLGFVAAGSCDDTQTIVRLSGTSDIANNSHVSLWNQNPGSAYNYEVCYNELFGDDYAGENPHGANSYNTLAYLNSTANSHISLEENPSYTVSINYGNLKCYADSTAGDDCFGGGELAFRTFDTINSHAADPDYDSYGIKVCCFNVYWLKPNGEIATSAQVGDTVYLVAPLGAYGGFSIKEDDAILDDNIRTGNDEITNGVEDEFRYFGEWEITLDDFLKGADEQVSDFYFDVQGPSGNIRSNLLRVSGSSEGDDATEITMASPLCGEYFNETEGVWLNVSADDEDDPIEGTLEIIDSEGKVFYTKDFSNEGLSEFFVGFKEHPGEYSVVVSTNSGRGQSELTSNIMILDIDISGSSYVDGNYTAACLLSPVSYEDYSEEIVNFDASTTRGVNIDGGVLDVLVPGEDAFIWEWNFEAAAGANFVDGGVVSATLKSPGLSEAVKYYKFGVRYPSSGSKTATLRVSLS